MVRAVGKTDIFDLKVVVDLASDLVRVEKDRVYFFSINQDKTKGAEFYNPKDDAADTYFKNWDYVVHGTVFEVKELANDIQLAHQRGLRLLRRPPPQPPRQEEPPRGRLIRSWRSTKRCTSCSS